MTHHRALALLLLALALAGVWLASRSGLVEGGSDRQPAREPEPAATGRIRALREVESPWEETGGEGDSGEAPTGPAVNASPPPESEGRSDPRPGGQEVMSASPSRQVLHTATTRRKDHSRPTTRLLALAVVDSDGQAIPDPVFAGGEHEPVDLIQARLDGELWLVPCGPGPLHLWVEAGGFRLGELPAFDSDGTLVLERGPRVRWVVLGAWPTLPEDWQLEAGLCREDPLGLARPVPRVELGPEPVEFHVSSPGSYQAGYRLEPRDAGEERSGADFREDPAPRYQVIETPLVQILRVPAPSPALWQEMLTHIERAE